MHTSLEFFVQMILRRAFSYSHFHVELTPITTTTGKLKLLKSQLPSLHDLQPIFPLLGKSVGWWKQLKLFNRKGLT